MDQAQVLIGLLRKVGGVLRVHQRLLSRVGAVSLPLLLSLLSCLQGLCKAQQRFSRSSLTCALHAGNPCSFVGHNDTSALLSACLLL